MTSSPRGARRRRPVLVPVASALAATGIGVTALLGGLRQAPEEPPPTADPGDVIDQGQYRTQFIKAIDTTEKDDFGTLKRYLEVVLKVTNMGNATASVGVIPRPGDKAVQGSSFASSLLTTRPQITTKYGPDVSVLSYGITSRQLQPKITATVVVKYELEPAATPPATFGVDVGAFTYGAIGLRDQTPAWQLKGDDADGGFVPEVAARITLPVRQEHG